MGCSGGIVAEGAGGFAVIQASVGGMGCAPGCTVGTVSYLGSPSGTESLSMGLSAGFCLLGHFCGPIPSAWGVYSGRWVVAGGRWAVLWVFRQFCGRFHGRLVVIRGLCLRGGLTWGAVVHLPWHGGPILVTFEAGCAVRSTQPTWRKVGGAPQLCPCGRSLWLLARQKVMVVGC